MLTYSRLKRRPSTWQRADVHWGVRLVLSRHKRHPVKIDEPQAADSQLSLLFAAEPYARLELRERPDIRLAGKGQVLEVGCVFEAADADQQVRIVLLAKRSERPWIRVHLDELRQIRGEQGSRHLKVTVGVERHQAEFVGDCSRRRSS